MTLSQNHKIFAGPDRLHDVQILGPLSEGRGHQVVVDGSGQREIALQGSEGCHAQIELISRIGKNKTLEDLYDSTDPIDLQVVIFEQKVDKATKKTSEQDVRTLKFKGCKPVRRVYALSDGTVSVVLVCPGAPEVSFPEASA